MNKNLVVGVTVGAIVIGGIAFFSMGTNVPGTKNDTAYCSSDGTLTDTMPIQSHRSYCIKSDSQDKTYVANSPQTYSFSIVDDRGSTLKNFAITHTKQMHVIVVRKDLVNFQHVHPEFDATTGVFTLRDLTFQNDGEYRVFADFAPAGGMKDPMGMPLVVTLSEDVAVGDIGNYRPQPLGGEERTKTYDSARVTLSTMPKTLVSGAESMMTFSLSEGGGPIADLEEYLGALGHSVVLREGTLDFIHAHPMDNRVTNQNGKVEFMVAFPQSGIYKVFTQFQRDGKVFTTDFVISATEGSDNAMPMMDHSMQ